MNESYENLFLHHFYSTIARTRLSPEEIAECILELDQSDEEGANEEEQEDQEDTATGVQHHANVAGEQQQANEVEDQQQANAAVEHDGRDDLK